MTGPALSGRELARLFHADVVAPLLARAMPGLRYAAGRLGSGSDVLGLDDEMSRDHDWGCRLTLLVDEPDRGAVPQISGLLERDLPESYRGWPVRFPVTWDTSVSHKVEVATVAGFAASRLGTDPAAGLSVPDWLMLSGQSVLEVTAGPVFTDQTRELALVRAMLAWYPADVERYVLACGWEKIAQQLPMAGRIACRGDELGSRLLSARLSGDLMWLAFALSHRWPPYAKWRGTIFRALPVAAGLAAPLTAAVLGPPVPHHRPGDRARPAGRGDRAADRQAAARYRLCRAMGGQRRRPGPPRTQAGAASQLPALGQPRLSQRPAVRRRARRLACPACPRTAAAPAVVTPRPPLPSGPGQGMCTFAQLEPALVVFISPLPLAMTGPPL